MQLETEDGSAPVSRQQLCDVFGIDVLQLPQPHVERVVEADASEAYLGDDDGMEELPPAPAEEEPAVAGQAGPCFIAYQSTVA
jgi:hypothetical protein